MPKGEPRILVEKKDKIGYIIVNIPETNNSFVAGDSILLEDAFNDCENDPNLRVVIITARGKFFTAGDDLQNYAGSNQEEALSGDIGWVHMAHREFLELEYSDYQIPLQRMGITMINSAKVYIAAVNGPCYAPELLWYCDFIIAADVATICQGDTMLGVCPGGGATQIVPRIIGRFLANEVILQAKEISAEEGYRMGFINKVVPLDQLLPESEALAKIIIKRSPYAIKLAKVAMAKSMDLPLKEGQQLEQRFFAYTMSSDAPRQFAEKFLARKKKDK